MNGVGDAHAAAMMQQQQQHVQARVQQQHLGVSLPMATSFAPEQASAKPRPPGLPPTPPPAFGGQRPSPGDSCMEVDAAAAILLPPLFPPLPVVHGHLLLAGRKRNGDQGFCW